MMQPLDWTRTLLWVQLIQDRQDFDLPDPWRLEVDPALIMDKFLSLILRPPGDGVENSLFYSISSFTSFTPTIPGTIWYQFSFPAPKPKGSSELGVFGLTCIGG